MFELIEVTAAYSNAVLVAILPHISHFVEKLELPVPSPVAASQVELFRCSNRRDIVGGRLVLTNGFEFVFFHGGTQGFESPNSFYNLQDPSKIPEFYGPSSMAQDEALALARKLIGRLPWEGLDRVLAAEPKVSGPPNAPRYRFEWRTGRNSAKEIDAEVNTATKSLEMLELVGPRFMKESPEISVVPPIDPKWERRLAAARETAKPLPVSPAYSNALLKIALPEAEVFARKLGLPVPVPMLVEAVTNAFFGQLLAGPSIHFELASGFGFVYQHGYVCAFHAPDCFFAPVARRGGKTYDDFIAEIRMTEKEMVDFARAALHKLGHTKEDLPILAKEPILANGPERETKPDLSRFFFVWDYSSAENPYPPPIISLEIDASTRTLKSLSMLDTNLWKTPPTIDAPP